MGSKVWICQSYYVAAFLYIPLTCFISLFSEVIIESALHKCVLKPLKVPIDTYLREIHNKDGSFKLLKENQQVIQNTTTTELGVTTSVPESALLERIFHKFTTMTKAYSPEKKISILLKSCKLIYDSMTQGNPGTIFKKTFKKWPYLLILIAILIKWQWWLV